MGFWFIQVFSDKWYFLPMLEDLLDMVYLDLGGDMFVVGWWWAFDGGEW